MNKELESLIQPKHCRMFIHPGVYIDQFQVNGYVDNMVNLIGRDELHRVGVSMCGNTLIVAVPPDTECGATKWEIYDCQVRRYGYYDPTRKDDNSGK